MKAQFLSIASAGPSVSRRSKPAARGTADGSACSGSTSKSDGLYLAGDERMTRQSAGCEGSL